MSDLPPGVTVEPIFVVEATYAPDAAETRVPFRPEHLAGMVSRLRSGRYVAAGAFTDMTASMLLVRAADADEAVALVSDDVYMRNGVWVEVRARPFGLVTSAGG